MKLKVLAFPSEGIKQHRDLSECYCGERTQQYSCVKNPRQIILVQLKLDALLCLENHSPVPE